MSRKVPKDITDQNRRLVHRSRGNVEQDAYAVFTTRSGEQYVVNFSRGGRFVCFALDTVSDRRQSLVRRAGEWLERNSVFNHPHMYDYFLNPRHPSMVAVAEQAVAEGVRLAEHIFQFRLHVLMNLDPRVYEFTDFDRYEYASSMADVNKIIYRVLNRIRGVSDPEIVDLS